VRRGTAHVGDDFDGFVGVVGVVAEWVAVLDVLELADDEQALGAVLLVVTWIGGGAPRMRCTWQSSPSPTCSCTEFLYVSTVSVPSSFSKLFVQMLPI
jgi:hypothetical protein